MKKKKTIIAALVLALVAAIGGTLAYFTDSDTKDNIFTFGKGVNITLNEDNWTEENGRNAIAGKEITKDPTITLEDDSVDAYVFMKVEMPILQGETTSIDPFILPAFNIGKKDSEGNTQWLTTSNPNEDSKFYIREDYKDTNHTWYIDLSRKIENDSYWRNIDEGYDESTGKYYYVFAYSDKSDNINYDTLKSLKAGEKTKTLFDSVKLNKHTGSSEYNLLDSPNIDISAYAVQSDGLNMDTRNYYSLRMIYDLAAGNATEEQ